MALSLLCGGLGVATAADGTVHVQDIAATATSKEVYTTDKVYTKTETDGQLALKANATDVAKNTENIATNKENIHTLDGKLANLTTAVNGKADAANVYTKNDADAKLALKADVTALNDKADKADVYSKTDADDRYATKTELQGKITEEETARKAADVELTGKITAEETARTNADNALDNRLTTAEGKIGANETAIGDLKAKDTVLEGKITTLDGKVTTDIADLKAKDIDLEGKIQTNANNIQTNKNDITTIKQRTAGIDRIDARHETTIEGHVTVDDHGNVTADGKLKGEGVDAGAVNAGSLNVENASHLKGDVTMDNKLSVTGDTTLKGTKVDGKLTVTDEADLKNTTVGGTLGVTGEATFKDKVTMDKDLEVKGELKTDKIAMENKKTDADGRHNSSTTITADYITHIGEVEKSGVTTKSSFIHNEEGSETYAMKGDAIDQTETRSDVTADGVKTEVKDSKGNRTNTSQTKEGIKGYATDKDGNKTYTKVTATENSFQIQDKDRDNKNHQVNTKDSSVTEITNAAGATTKTEQTAENITNIAQSGTITNDAQNIVNNASENITNTAQNGTITNDAKNIVNNASENITTTAKTMNTTVSGQATESYGGLNTTVNGAENHTVNGKQINTVGDGQINNITGNQTTTVTGDISNTAKNITNEAETTLTDKVGTNTRVIDSTSITDTVGTANRKIEDGKITDTAGDFTVTTDKANGTTFAKTGSTAYSTKAGAPTDTNIAGNLITTGRVDANELGVSDKDGANTADLSVEAGEGKGVKASAGNGTTTGSLDVTAKEVGSSVKDDASGKGSTFKQRIDAIMGNVKTADGESEVTQKGNEITSKVGLGEATNSRVTQKKDLLEAAVTDGTNYNISNDTANESAKELRGGTKVNRQYDNLNGSQKTITNGTYTTSKLQTALDITNTAEYGTITNDAKDIVNNATGDMTNTVGGKLTTTVTGQATENFKGGLKTDITGEEIHTVTGNQTNKVTGKQTNTVEGGQENIISGGQINNITGDQTTTISGTQTTTATDINRNASSSMVDKVDNAYGTNTETKVAGKTTTDVSIKGTGEEGKYIRGANESRDYLIKGTLKNSETKTAEATSTEITDGNGKTSATIQDVTQISGSVKEGTNTSVQNQTASAIAADVKDGAGNENASVANATTSANTITNGTKANTVISTADGTSFINSEAAAPVTGASGAGTHLNTTIKGNTITTGKVTMDYADVMKDLGVRGNANITGKTTTGSLEVTGTSTLTGDVTMGSNATVKGTFNVEGNTNLKNTKVDGTLNVTQKATFDDSVSIAKDLSVGGDVTANSYKVDGKTYIDANGINANDQKITNVADGSISEGSKDAVNGGQLYGVKRDLEHQVDKVGANAAAMANLRPMEFDPSSKWNIAAAIGNYGSETAAAIGAFYRPNDNVMVNLSTAFGTGENMVGGGVSVRLGKGGNKLSREETNALKAQVADLTARMDALLSVLNPNMSKDFPDVPENHWAYEAVSRLAGNDIVQGYPDGEFHGERTMTRYEMAEIIYNALSRGAEAERKLVEEFKPELQAMAASEKATAERTEG